MARLSILETFRGQSSGAGGSGVLLVEHFLMKSAFRVSTPSALLASVLSWSVLMTWKVKLHVLLPLLALKVT